jgi:hypothetical protein
VGNERLITGLPPARCMFFGLIARIVILYRRKGSPEIEVTVVNKLDMYVET